MYLCTQTASVALGLKLTAGSGEKKYFLCGVPVLFPEVRPHCGGAPQVVAFFGLVLVLKPFLLAAMGVRE